ncbi:MAG: hypothetical protein M0R40_10280, partial [Firmicutes bacterium]|nr:hypothetical protein [Bacillota bacterium]
DGQIDIGTIPDVLAEVEGLQAEAAPKPEVQTKEAILKQYETKGYNRYYDSKRGVMSRSGYAMFAEGNLYNRGSMFGDRIALYDGKQSIKAEDLKPKIIDAWESYKNSDAWENDLDLHYLKDISAQEIADSFNPKDIINSAEAYDNEAVVAWLWEYVLEPNDIYAITTNDGAIVFDEDLITHKDIHRSPQQARTDVKATNEQISTQDTKQPVRGAQSATAQDRGYKSVENAKRIQDIDSLNESILSKNVKETKLVKTIKESLNIKSPIDAEFKAKLASMESLYRVTDNKTQKRVAKKFVDNNFEYAERYIKESEVLQTAADAAIISEIIERYRQTGRADEALAMIRQTAVKFSKAGQHVQSAAIWAKMTPEGAIKGIEQSIAKMNKTTRKQFSMSEQDAQYVMDNVVKLSNLNAPELANLFIEISKKRNRNLGKSTNAELEYLVSQNNISTLKDAVYQNLVLTVLDKVPRSLGRKISTIQAFSHLINPRTIIRNVVSNTLFKYQEMLSDYSSAIFDILISLKTKQRTVAMPDPRNVKQNFEASKNYARRANFEIQTGIHLDDTQGKYELFALETFTALNNKVLNKIEKLLGYGLKTPDQFAKGAVEISEIRRQLALMGKNVQGKTIEELFEMADNETLTIAKQKALYNTFQDDGFIAGFLQSAKKLLNKVGLNKGDWGLGDLTIKYTRVPGNLIQRAIDYTPLGALKVLKYIGTKNLTRTQQRDIAQTFGRAITGTTMIWIGSLLSQLGIIISPPDENKREKDFFKDAGLTGRQINISAIERLIEGKDVALQEGDHFLSFDFLETINPHLSMGHELAKATDKQYTADKIAASVSNTFFDEILDLPTMYIINSMVYEGQKEDGTFIDVVSVPFTQAIPGFIPAPLRQAVSAADSTQRERKGWEDSVILNTPWRGTLPPSLGTFGQKKKQDTGILTFFNPGRSSTYLPLRFTKELKNLVDKFGDYELYPSGTKVKKFNRNGKTYELSEKEQQEFMVLYGDILADYYDIILSSKLSDEEKIKKLKRGQTEIKDMVKDNYLFKKGK